MNSKKVLAAVMAAAMFAGTATAFTKVTAADDSSSKSTVIFSTSFEDGDVSAFSNRGGGDVTVMADSTEQAKTGTHSMKLTGRTKTWGGPSINVSKLCNPNQQYLISLSYFCPWYSDAQLSMQYTDESGVDHYSNLGKVHAENSWGDIESIKFSFTSSMSNVQLYLEQTAEGSYVDDVTIETVPEIAIQDDIASLSDLYKDDFKIGTSILTSNLADKPFMNLVKKHFSGSMTAGNEMKPESVLVQSKSQENAANGDETMPVVDMSSANDILNYCIENKVPIRAHTLVWHSQTPNWFFKEGFKDDGAWVSKDVMLKRMENFIKLYFEALQPYIDKGLDVYACDVVNEAWTESGTPRNARDNQTSGDSSAWVKVFGDNSFIEPAFEYARKYAPSGCKLYYNDYNEYYSGKRDAIVKMANELKAKGLIDGIGMQSHLAVGSPLAQYANNSPSYLKALQQFAETGLDIQVTELDVTTDDTSEAGLKKQAEYYGEIWKDILQYKDHISAVVLWGVTDDQSWRASRLPLLFDSDYQAKDAYYTIADLADSEPITTTTTSGNVTTTTTTTESISTTTTPAITTIDLTTSTTETTVTTTTEPTSETNTTNNKGNINVKDGEVSLWGDADTNGEFSISDAVFLCRGLTGMVDIPDQGRINANLYQVGTSKNVIDTIDSEYLMKYLVNSVQKESLPITK